MSLLRHHQLLMSAKKAGPDFDFGQTFYWPMQDASGIVMNEVMQSRNGTYSGVDFLQPGYRSGVNSVYFDGVNDLAAIPHDNSLNPGTGEYAWEFWLKMESDPGSQFGNVIGKFNGGMSPSFPGATIFSNLSNNASYSVGSVTAREQNTTGYWQSYSLPFAATTWNHFVVQRRIAGGTGYLQSCINGSIIATTTLPTITNINNLAEVNVMGRAGGVQTTRGYMSHIRYYIGKSFSPAELAAIYAARVS